MTITVNSLGDNSASISYSVGINDDEFLDTIVALVSGKGWELYDNPGSSSRVIRSLCADGQKYKYVYLFMDAGTNRLIPQLFEFWDNVSHSGTNPAYESNNALIAGQPYDVTLGGDLIVYANARYLAFFGRNAGGRFGNTNNQTWSGCIEIAKDNGEEANDGFPLFAFTTGYMLLGCEATGSTCNCFSLPRTFKEGLGIDGLEQSAVTCTAGAVCYSNDASSLMMNTLPVSILPEELSPSGNCQAFTLYAKDFDSKAIRGRFYGVKLLPRSLGSDLDTIDMRVDAEMFFDINASTVLKHHIISVGNDTNGRFAFPE